MKLVDCLYIICEHYALSTSLNLLKATISTSSNYLAFHEFLHKNVLYWSGQFEARHNLSGRFAKYI